ncbi:MAG: UPF0175 family protein [Candidatus Methylomirabilis sp.]|nr:UPF0175 family protein [Deltaproteobacteria bacterium]
MTITFDIPTKLEEAIRAEGQDPSRAAKEAFLVELYREGKLYHGEFAEALGLSRYEADGVLKRHGVFLETTDEEVQDEVRSLRNALER